MQKFYENGVKKYTIHDLNKNNSRLVYWIIFPQTIVKIRPGYRSSDTIMTARTKQKAFKKLEKYNGAYIEVLIKCDLGRWLINCITKREDGKLSIEQIWDKYSTLPEIKL